MKRELRREKERMNRRGREDRGNEERRREKI